MLKRIAIIFCLSGLQVIWGMGQRVVGTIDPNATLELDEELRFDTNWIPVSSSTIDQNNSLAQSYYGNTIDLNFCPNVVFTSDSNRGFVSYTGSDKVMVFNPKTREIIDLVSVPSNPGNLVLSPDGTKIAFPNHYLDELVPDAHDHNPLIGGVSIMDTETLEVVSVEFDDVAFSFFNNILFSEDGSVIFISSLKTDEMLMLDAETLTEISPRLQFTPGTRPASMTRIPGTTKVAVVLVGSYTLNRDIHPDSLAIVDLSSFSILKTLHPEVDEDSTDTSLYVDFTATTNIAFSDDGKWGAIADQELSSQSSLPTLSSDRVWILDVENEEFVDYDYSPGVSGSTYWVPSTGEFVTVGSMSIILITPSSDPEDLDSRVITPSRGDFRSRSSLALLDDDETLMIPSPSYDSLMMINYVDGITKRGIVTGGMWVRDPSEEKDCDLCVECLTSCTDICEEDYEDSSKDDDDLEDYTDCISDCDDECEETCDGCEYLMEAPMQISYTPDGELFAVVSYNNNVIYMAKDTYTFPIPRLWVNNSTNFAGVAFVNPTDEDAELWGAAYSDNGIVLADDEDTEDVVEYANPIVINLPAGSQKTFVAEELIQPSTQDSFFSWIDMDSDRKGVTGLVLYGDDKLKSLDGVDSSTKCYQRLVFPDIRVKGTKVNGELVILNPNLQSADVEITLYNEFGGSINSFTYSIPTKSVYSVYLKDYITTDDEDSGLFSESIWNYLNYGYLEVVTDDGAIQGYLRGMEKNKMSILPAWGEGSPESETTSLYIPTVVTLQGAESWINIVNTNYSDDEDDDGDGEDDDLDDENVTVTIKLWTDYGTTLSRKLVLVERNSFRIELKDLFDLYETGEYMTGWLEVTSDRTGIAGNVELRLNELSMTQIPLQAPHSNEFLLAHVAQGNGLETGVSLLNPSDEDVEVSMKVYNSNGELTGESTFTLPALTHLSQLLTEYIPEFGEQSGGYVKLVSSDDIVVLELFYKQDLEYVASVVPQ